MKENWTDFEKYVFEKLEKVDARLSKLEARVLVIATGASALVSIVLRMFG